MYIVSEDPPYVFVHIPKNAGTSISDLIRRKAVEQKHCLVKNQLEAHASLREIEDIGELPPGALVFCVVRNPWDRVWSYYNFRMKKLQERINQRAEGHPVKRATSDEEDRKLLSEYKKIGFARWVVTDTSPSTSDGIAFNRKPQMMWIEDPEEKAEAMLFLRFEHLEDDIQMLHPLFGKLSLEHLNASNPPRKYQDVYDDVAREHIASYFAPDIERFSYKF